MPAILHPLSKACKSGSAQFDGQLRTPSNSPHTLSSLIFSALHESCNLTSHCLFSRDLSHLSVAAGRKFSTSPSHVLVAILVHESPDFSSSLYSFVRVRNSIPSSDVLMATISDEGLSKPVFLMNPAPVLSPRHGQH